MIKTAKEFTSLAKRWIDILEKEKFTTAKWHMSKEAWDDKYGDNTGARMLRRHMVDCSRFICYLYETFEEKEKREAFATAWKYYIIISQAQNKHLDFVEAIKDIDLIKLRVDLDYPELKYHPKYIIRFEY